MFLEAIDISNFFTQSLTHSITITIWSNPNTISILLKNLIVHFIYPHNTPLYKVFKNKHKVLIDAWGLNFLHIFYLSSFFKVLRLLSIVCFFCIVCIFYIFAFFPLHFCLFCIFFAFFAFFLIFLLLYFCIFKEEFLILLIF